YAGFLADVQARGVKVPLELIPGTQTVIDGRTRLRAAREAGLKSVPVVDADLNGEGPTVYMLRAAVSRRHLSSSQRAALAVEIEAEWAKAAKDRQREAAKRGGEQSGKTRRGEEPKVVARIPQPSPSPKARDQAAAEVKTNPRYVSDAKAIKEKAPELHEKVKAGELTIPQARL